MNLGRGVFKIKHTTLEVEKLLAEQIWTRVKTERHDTFYKPVLGLVELFPTVSGTRLKLFTWMGVK